MASKHEEVPLPFTDAELAEWRARDVALIRRAEAILLGGYQLLGPSEEEDLDARAATTTVLLRMFVEAYERSELVKVSR